MVVNTWDQMVKLGGDRWCVFLDKGQSGRAYRAANAQVVRFVQGRPVPTDPDNDKIHWQDLFGPHGLRMRTYHTSWELADSPALALLMAGDLARDWATVHLGPEELVRNRMGDWVPIDAPKIWTDRQREEWRVSRA